jgi:hypothetical protein
LLTFALALVLPLRARAAIVPICEDEPMTLAPAPSEPSCAIVTSVDEVTGETSAAPICDARGASSIAPPRILPITDARIDAVPGCNGQDAWPSVGPSSRDPAPAAELAGPPQRALLAPELVVAGPTELVILSFAAPSGGPRAGVEQGVYHPPR